MHRPPLWIGVASAGLLISQLCLCRGNGSATNLPFDLHGHLVVVKGSIGPLDDLNFIIDTGASLTVVNTRVARELGLKGPKQTVTAYGGKQRVEQVTLPDLRLGNLEFEDLPAQTAQLSFTKMDRRLRIDGLIGLDLIRRTSLTIDYETGTLTFGPVEHSGSTMPFYGKLPLVPVPLMIGGRRFSMLLDTGAEHVILFRRRLAGKISLRATRQKKEIVCLGRLETLNGILVQDISLGEVSWEEFHAYVLDVPVPDWAPDGILGVASLGLRRLNLDFENHRVSWER